MTIVGCSMKGDVKRYSSPDDWNTDDFRDIQPPCDFCVADS